MPLCYVTARLTAWPGREDQLLSAMLANLPRVRAEPGCVRYDLLRHADLPGVFLFNEAWESPEALAAHAASAHMRAYHETVADCIADRAVETWTAADPDA